MDIQIVGAVLGTAQNFDMVTDAITVYYDVEFSTDYPQLAACNDDGEMINCNLNSETGVVEVLNEDGDITKRFQLSFSSVLVELPLESDQPVEDLDEDEEADSAATE